MNKKFLTLLMFNILLNKSILNNSTQNSKTLKIVLSLNNVKKYIKTKKISYGYSSNFLFESLKIQCFLSYIKNRDFANKDLKVYIKK